MVLVALCCWTMAFSAAAQSTIEQIALEPAAGLSDEFVSVVDILFVYDANLLNQLPFTQFDWVSGKDAYLEREDNLLDMVQLRIAPNSPRTEIELPARFKEAVGILVFASHEDPVAEALDISLETTILLCIESYGINVISH